MYRVLEARFLVDPVESAEKISFLLIVESPRRNSPRSFLVTTKNSSLVLMYLVAIVVFHRHRLPFPCPVACQEHLDPQIEHCEFNDNPISTKNSIKYLVAVLSFRQAHMHRVPLDRPNHQDPSVDSYAESSDQFLVVHLLILETKYTVVVNRN